MDYSFKAIFGDDIRTVTLTQPHGAGSIFYIMIDNYYHGSVNLMLGGWHVYFNSKDFTAADSSALLETMVSAKLINDNQDT